MAITRGILCTFHVFIRFRIDACYTAIQGTARTAIPEDLPPIPEDLPALPRPDASCAVYGPSEPAATSDCRALSRAPAPAATAEEKWPVPATAQDEECPVRRLAMRRAEAERELAGAVARQLAEHQSRAEWDFREELARQVRTLPPPTPYPAIAELKRSHATTRERTRHSPPWPRRVPRPSLHGRAAVPAGLGACRPSPPDILPQRTRVWRGVGLSCGGRWRRRARSSSCS